MSKKIMTIVCVVLSAFNIFGCGSATTTEPSLPNAELKDKSTVCGVVREVEDENIRVQLCGNRFEAESGKCYINIGNEYEFKIGDFVLVYYDGKIDYEKYEDYIEVVDVEVCYVEEYENDAQFRGCMRVIGTFCDENGMPYSGDDPRNGCTMLIEPADGEPECNFIIYYYNNKENDVVITPKDEKIDFYDEFVVTYDTETMEIISMVE